ncbi:MAG TPA: hypothetical protein VGG81_07070 [Edaphobacter sp.]|jgi:hypothetical protein
MSFAESALPTGIDKTNQGEVTELSPLFLLLLFSFAVFCPKIACQAPNSHFSHPKILPRPHKTRANPAFPHIQPSKK